MSRRRQKETCAHRILRISRAASQRIADAEARSAAQASALFYGFQRDQRYQASFGNDRVWLVEQKLKQQLKEQLVRSQTDVAALRQQLAKSQTDLAALITERSLESKSIIKDNEVIRSSIKKLMDRGIERTVELQKANDELSSIKRVLARILTPQQIDALATWQVTDEQLAEIDQKIRLIREVFRESSVVPSKTAGGARIFYRPIDMRRWGRKINFIQSM